MRRENVTAADVLGANKGVGPGFDALRLGLSVWVFTLHAAYIGRADGVSVFAANPFHRILLTPVLPMFFMVSGYLVTGSAIRTRFFSTFLLFRAFRIVPALFVETALSALVLGPWLTEKTLAEYFSDPLLYKYFLNIIGRAHFYLPGLFLKNPFPMVNGNMWTLKPEFYCYIFMSIMILLGAAFSKIQITLVSGAILIVALIYEFAGGKIIDFIGLVNWKMLVVAFTLGCLAYHWNDRLVISYRNLALALVTAFAGLMYPPAIVAGFLALTYIVVYVGTLHIPLPLFLREGDYSYGIYLFGFPIQQTVVYFLPLEYRNGVSIMVLALPLTLMFAMLSWTLVEKPALRLKKWAKAGAYPRSPPDMRFERIKASAPSQ